VLDAAGHVPRTGDRDRDGPQAGAQLIAAMRRTVATTTSVRPAAHRALTPPEIEALDQAARQYGEYLRLKAQIILP
jgi:hypothetical protein